MHPRYRHSRLTVRQEQGYLTGRSRHSERIGITGMGTPTFNRTVSLSPDTGYRKTGQDSYESIRTIPLRHAYTDGSFPPRIRIASWHDYVHGISMRVYRVYRTEYIGIPFWFMVLTVVLSIVRSIYCVLGNKTDS